MNEGYFNMNQSTASRNKDGIEGSDVNRSTPQAAKFAIYELVYEKKNPLGFRVHYVSPSIVNLLGISNPLEFERWFENIHPDDLEVVTNAHRQAFETGQFDQTFRICHPQDNQIRWIRGLSTMTAGETTEGHDNLRITGVILDVTAQKKLVASEQLNDKRLKSIAETIPDVIFEMDPTGRIVFCTKAVKSLLGYSLEEIKGKHFAEMTPPDFLKTAEESMSYLNQGNSIQNIQVDIIRKDGQHISCEVSASPIFINKKLVGIHGILRDTSDSKKAELACLNYQKNLEAEMADRTRELMKSEARYRGIVEGSPDMVFRFLQDGTITFANRACCDYFHTEIKTLLGQNVFQLLSPGENVEETKIFLGFSSGQSLQQQKELEVRRTDGSVKWFRWVGQGFINDDESLIEFQAIIQDITEQKKSEIQKKRRDRYEKRVQKLEALGTLSAGIAHDFNNILAVLLGNVQLAMDDVEKGSRIQNNMDEMIKAIIRARDMVQQILTFCRKGEETLRPLKLNHVTKECIKFLKSTLPATIEIRENIFETEPVLADPSQISQVIMNLGTNASQAIGREVGVIEITLETINIDPKHKDYFRVLAEGKFVKITFSDTGCGMTSDIVTRIFDPYFTTKAEGEGTGMGLAVVHGIVEGYGGTIWVSSAPGKGTVFKILFPVVQDDQVLTEMESSAPVVGGDECILLIDDRENLLKVEKDLLEHLGYKVEATTNPTEALEIFRERPHRFDLVYTDLTMPHMDGLTLSKKIMEIQPKIPIILFTGLGELVEEDAIKQSGIQKFLKKPILLEDLAFAIREVIENAKKERP